MSGMSLAHISTEEDITYMSGMSLAHISTEKTLPICLV